MTANNTKKNLEELHKKYMFLKFNKSKYAFLALMASVYISLALQGVFVLFCDSLLQQFGDITLKHKIEKFCVAEISVSACMIIVHFIVIKFSGRSITLFKGLSFLRGILLCGYVEFNIEILIAPLGSTENSTLSVFSKAALIQLMVLIIGFAAFEPIARAKFWTVTIASVLLVAEITYPELICLIPSLVICAALLAFLYLHCKTDQEIGYEFYFQNRDGEIYQSFLDLLPEGVAILMEGTHLKYVNNSMLRILECSEDNLVRQMLDLTNVDAKKKSKKEKVEPEKVEPEKLGLKPLASIGVSDNEEESFEPKKSLILKNSFRPEDMKLSLGFERGKSESPEGKSEPSAFKSDGLGQTNSREDKYDRMRSDEMPEKPEDRRLANEDRTKSDHLVLVKEAEMLNYSEKDKSEEKEAIFVDENCSQHLQQKLLSKLTQRPQALSFDKANEAMHNDVNTNSPGWSKNEFVRKRTIFEEKDSSREMSIVSPRTYSLAVKDDSKSRNTLSKTPPRLELHGQYQIQGPQASSRSSAESSRPFNNTPNIKTPEEDSHKAANINDIETNFHQITTNKQQNEPAPSSILLKYSGAQNGLFSSKFKGFKAIKLPEKENSERLKHLEAQPSIINNNNNKFRVLKSYATTHENIRSAYDSIIHRLREDRADRQTQTSQSFPMSSEDKGWITKFFRKLFSRNNDKKPVSNHKLNDRKEDGSRLRLDEEDCCIVINSKHKISETKERFLEVKLSPTFIDTKPCILVLVKDTTERDLINTLKETDNYKNTLMASVSHELRTPLNCIISMQEMLREYVSEDLITKYLDPAINSSKILLSLVNDILDFAQIRAGKLRLRYKEFQLYDLLKEAIALFEIQTKNRDVEIKFDWDSRIPAHFNSDPHRIRQIVINLLGNALKFTLKGSITVRALHKGSRRVCIMVKDTGLGIKKEDFGKMFSSFGKIDNEMNPHGVGLGLQISQTLAQRLGPKDNRGIKIQSEYGKGSCFYFMIESFPKEKTDRKNQMNEENQFEQGKLEQSELEEDKHNGGRKYDRHESNGSKADANLFLSDDEFKTSGPSQNMYNFNKRIETLNRIRYQSTLSPTNNQTKPTNESKNNFGSLVEPISPESWGFEAGRLKEKSTHSKAGLDTIVMSTTELPQPIRLTIPERDKPFTLQLQQVESNSARDQTERQNKIQVSFGESKFKELLGVSENENQNTHRLLTLPLNRFVGSTDYLNVLGSNAISSNGVSTKVASTNLLGSNVVSTNALYTPQNISLNKNFNTFGALVVKSCKCEDILVVDDNDFNLLAMRQLLESMQYKIMLAHNGQIAIDTILQKQKSDCCKAFCLVLMDCDMPVKNGFQAAKELKTMQKNKQIPYFPIIATTAYVNKREIDRCFESGMDAYLNKPVMKTQLEDILKKWFKR